MAFQISAGTLIVEKDLTTTVPSVPTSIGGYVGQFQWGPVLDVSDISSELDLIRFFGKPNENTFASFFSAANFLGYANSLKLVRVVGATAINATAGTPILIKNKTAWEDTYSTDNSDVYGPFAAKYPGGVGNGLRVSMADSASFETALTGTITTLSALAGTISSSTASATVTGGSSSFLSEIVAGALIYSSATYIGKVLSVESNTSLTLTDLALATVVTAAGSRTIATITGGGTAFLTETHVGAKLYTSAGVLIGTVLSIAGDTTLTFTTVAKSGLTTASGVKVFWVFHDQFDSAPGTSDYATQFGGSLDELHIIVEDHDGLFSGVPGTILEKFVGASKASDAKTSDGATNYYKELLATSDYVWWMDHPNTFITATSNWGSGASVTFKTLKGAVSCKLAGGLDGSAPTNGNIEAGYDLFLDSDLVDVNLLFTGQHALAVGKYVIENVVEVRRDCVATVSPSLASVYNNAGSEAEDIVAERVNSNFNVNSSYGIMDCNWKYQYDKYNDKYRWIPLNPDIAGLMARTDNTNDPWWSPGGITRGLIKNVTKLAWNPNKSQRDTLYKNSINPVITKRGQGTVLWGDKTLLSKPSAFDRINVRRLFIVLEKSIAIAAETQLFEFNDAFTRSYFRNIVEPFLRDVKSRRGVTDFLVVCNETNNTPEVIDRNEFIADIFIKPTRSINFITLSFVATRTGVSFTEVQGA